LNRLYLAAEVFTFNPATVDALFEPLSQVEAVAIAFSIGLNTGQPQGLAPTNDKNAIYRG